MLSLKKISILSVLFSILLAACSGGSISGSFSVTSGQAVFTETTLTLKAGMQAYADSDVTFTKVDATNGNSTIVFSKGQKFEAVTDVVFDYANGTMVGEIKFTTDPSATLTPTALPAPTSTVTATVVSSAPHVSWICYTNGAKESLTYMQLMTSNPHRVEYPVDNLASCPFSADPAAVYYHWTQIGATGDLLGDTQGWLRQGTRENAEHECSLQTGWCLVAND